MANSVERGRLVLVGTGSFTSTSKKLTVNEFQIYEDGSGRHDYTKTETFVPGTAASMGSVGAAGTDYPAWLQPQPGANLIKTWTNVSSTPKGVAQLAIRQAGNGSLLVHEFGACSPSPCDNGRVGDISFGTSTTATSGKPFLAPFTLTNGNQRLSAKLTSTSTGFRLTLPLTEFTDGSGRPNHPPPRPSPDAAVTGAGSATQVGV